MQHKSTKRGNYKNFTVSYGGYLRSDPYIRKLEQLNSDKEKLQLDSFIAIAQNDSNLLRQILTVLVDDLQQFLEVIRKMDIAGDTDIFRKASHKIIPGLKMMGQMQLVSKLENYKELLKEADGCSINKKTDLTAEIFNQINGIKLELKNVVEGL